MSLDLMRERERRCHANIDAGEHRVQCELADGHDGPHRAELPTTIVTWQP